MGLEAVIAEIREKGRNETDVIVKESESKKIEILTIAQEKAENVKTAVRDEVEKTVTHIISQEEAAAHLVVKRQVLNTQKELMDDVYRQSLEKIRDMPESFHKEAIRSLLGMAKAEIPKGKVSCRKCDVDALKEILGDSEFKDYSFNNTVEIDGGIIVESENGQLQVDYSYRTFLNQVWDTGLKYASDKLFG